MTVLRHGVVFAILGAAACGGSPDTGPDAGPTPVPDADHGGPFTGCTNDPAPGPTTGDVQTLRPAGDIAEVYADWFGSAVAATDDVIVVAAVKDNHYADGEPGGSISVFEPAADTGAFERVAYFLSTTEYNFGASVATDGKIIAVGTAAGGTGWHG